jgi:hypothetical protein
MEQRRMDRENKNNIVGGGGGGGGSRVQKPARGL